MTSYLLAIDNGSQSTKVTIFDVRGRPVASARRRLEPYDTSVPGHAIHPGDDIWDSIRDACRAVMAGTPTTTTSTSKETTAKPTVKKKKEAKAKPAGKKAKAGDKGKAAKTVVTTKKRGADKRATHERKKRKRAISVKG